MLRRDERPFNEPRLAIATTSMCSIRFGAAGGMAANSIRLYGAQDAIKFSAGTYAVVRVDARLGRAVVELRPGKFAAFVAD
jgi:hypothetical protein